MFGFTFNYEENNDIMSNDDFFFYNLYFCNRTKTKLKINSSEQNISKQNQIKPNRTQIKPTKTESTQTKPN